MIKLLIVDDSALMRRQLMTVFQAEGDFEIRQARNGEEAVRENKEFKPDVVTLDINMPEMDGLTALSLIMAERPVPVLMVSSLTEQGALATFEALNLGAVDYVPKPGGTISLSLDKVAAELIAKVRSAARARPKSPGTNGSNAAAVVRRMRDERAKTVAASSALNAPRGASDGVVVIGASTGGPRALEIVLSGLPANFPWPVLVAQHMPAAFTKAFADRLDQCCPLSVVEAGTALPIVPGRIYIGKGGASLVLRAEKVAAQLIAWAGR
jgi:two-component system, chemotaxis family, protein-glutamate methylesterase/glutaminase